jgi:CBS domain containing-hemolysin-like protein
MILLFATLYVISLAALALFSFVQLLYLESLRLRAREYPALEYFKSTIQERLGLETDNGALIFTMYKHSLLVAIGVLSLLINQNGSTWLDITQGILLALLSMAVFSYLLPQLLYRRSEAHFLRPLAPLLRVTGLCMKPFAGMLNFVETLADISQPSAALEEGASPQEEIEALIAAGEEEGLIEEGDKKLIQSVVAFGDKRVREVMTPRPNIVGIEAARPLDDLRQLMLREQFSRIPVYEESVDHITGFIHVKDLFEAEFTKRKLHSAKDLERPIAFVPETKLVTDLLKEMQRAGNHMAIVVDEYGNTAGLATMEDLVEEVFGEIRDEHEPGSDVTDEGDGAFVMAGSYDLDHLRDLLDFLIPAGIESTTVGGLVTEWFGRVPKAGETFERDGLLVEVLASDERRVTQVRLRKSVAPEPETQNEETEKANEESA